MEHPTDGMIRAFLDGEAPGRVEGLRTHLGECRDCGVRAMDLTGANEKVSAALSLLDVPAPTERARVRVLREAADRQRFPRKLRKALPRAASFAVLLTAGAAAALPGSPVRQWVGRGWEGVTGGGAGAPSLAPVQVEGPGAETPARSELVGATVPLTSQGLELHLRGLSEEASLRILFVENDQAGIFAGEGTHFRTEAGRLEATAPPGDVRMEIPLQAARVRVIVDGAIYLNKTEQGMEVLGPVRTRTPTEIRFGPKNPGQNDLPSGG